jgi:anti-sigma-K factor RskA
MIDHAELETLVAAYLLGAAETEEAEAIRTHLDGCIDCRQLAARLRRAVGLLPMAAELEHPPARLKEAILAAAAASPRGQPHSPVFVRSLRRTRRARSWWLSLAATARRQLQPVVAGLLVALLGLGAWNLWLLGQLSRSRENVAKITLSGSGQLLGAEAMVVDFRDQGVALVSFSRLPRLPAGEVYELWLIPRGGQPMPAGVFQPESDGSKTLVLVKDLRRYQVIAVTLEAGPDGAPAPSQAPGISGNTV